MNCYRKVSILAVVVTALATAQAFGQSSLAADRMQIERNKDVVEQFFSLADKGDVEKVRPIVSDDFVEHASYQADGRDALLASVAANIRPAENGRRKEASSVIRMLAEGDQVWVYTRVDAAGTLVARMNMFRLEGGRIAEHWAVQEVVNLNRTNKNDQWAVGAGPQSADTQPKRVRNPVGIEQLERNKNAMRKFFLYSESSDPAERIKLLQWATTGPGGYIQHNATGQDGIEGFAGARGRAAGTPAPAGAAAAPPAGAAPPGDGGGGRGAGRGGGPLPHHELVRAIAEGDYVWCLNIPNFAQGSVQNGERANFNQWRLEGGKLAEHWGTYETVQPTRANSNDFFGFGRTQTRDLTR